jgi:hypothetical protein
MGNLITRFLAYALSNLTVLQALWAKFGEYKAQTASTLAQIQDAAAGLASRVTDNYTELKAKADAVAGQISAGVAQANQFTTDALAQLNFNVFGGKTASQWEDYISTTANGLVNSAEARLKALNETSQHVIVKLQDYVTSDIPFSTIAKPAPALGDVTTHRYLFEAPLGGAAIQRNITGLPGSPDTLNVSMGYEIYVKYDEQGNATYSYFADNEATVITNMLQTDAAQAQQITTIEGTVADLGNEFLAEKAKLDAFLVLIQA